MQRRNALILLAATGLLAACGTRPPPAPRAPPLSGPPTGDLGPEDALEAMLAADTDPRRNDLVTVALSQVGLPYLWGGRKPLEGFDCSGLVAYVYEQALRMSIPRVTSEQARYSTAVDDRDARAGDLVFYNTLHRDYSHVGLYIGRRRFVHSPATGAVVRVERMDGLYWLQRYNGTRRLLA